MGGAQQLIFKRFAWEGIPEKSFSERMYKVNLNFFKLGFLLSACSAFGTPPAERTIFEVHLRSEKADYFIIRDANSYELKLQDVVTGDILEIMSLETWMESAKKAFELDKLAELHRSQNRSGYEAELKRRWATEYLYREVRNVLLGKMEFQKRGSRARELLVGLVASAPFLLKINSNLMGEVRANLENGLKGLTTLDIFGEVKLERQLLSFVVEEGCFWEFFLSDQGKLIVFRENGKIRGILPLRTWELLLRESTDGTSEQYRTRVESTIRLARSSKSLPQNGTRYDYAMDIPFLIQLRQSAEERGLSLEAKLFAKTHTSQEMRELSGLKWQSFDQSLLVQKMLIRRLFDLEALF